MLKDKNSLIFAAVAQNIPGLKMVYGSQVPEMVLSSLFRSISAVIKSAENFPSDTVLQTHAATLTLKLEELLCCEKLNAPAYRNIINQGTNTAPTITDTTINACVGDTVISSFSDIFGSFTDAEGNQPSLFRIFNIQDNTNLTFNGTPIAEYQTYNHFPFSLQTEFDNVSYVPPLFTEPDPTTFILDTNPGGICTPNIIYYSSSQLQALIDQGYEITNPYNAGTQTVDLTNFTVTPAVTASIPAFNQGTGYTTSFQVVIRDNDFCEPLFSNSSTVTLNFDQKECSPVPDCTIITCPGESTRCDIPLNPTLCYGTATYARIENVIPNLGINSSTLQYYGNNLTSGMIIPLDQLSNLLFTPDTSGTPGATAFIIEYSLSFDGINFCPNSVTYTIEIDAATLPVITPFTAVTTESTSITATGVFTSVDTVASVLWTQTAGAAATITPNNTDTAVISGLTPGVYQFQFEVTTACGQMASELLDVTVNTPADNPPVVIGVSFPDGPCCKNTADITFNSITTIPTTDNCNTITTICVDGPPLTSETYTVQYTVTDTTGPTVLSVAPPSATYTVIFDGAGNACLIPIIVNNIGPFGNGNYDVEITVVFGNGDTIVQTFNQNCP